MSPESFSVSQLNNFIKDVVSSGFPSSLWVCGEIQNLDRYKSKAHLFFDLVEKAADAKEIKAKLGVTIWAGVRPKIEALLKKAENAFELKDGIEVKFSGKVDFYPPYGTLRFVIDTIDPIYTLGKIAQDRQRLITELTQSGVLARNKTRNFSVLPLNIGLISSFDSAAYNDFIHELGLSGFAFQVFFVNAVMQGKNCEASICTSLGILGKQPFLDAIIITRGGGSIAELSAFDSKMIALAIAACPYPVITGIGHEINTSIADLAAHTFAKTPTAVAQFLSRRIRESFEAMEACQKKMLTEARRYVETRHALLKERAIKLQNITRVLLQSQKNNQLRLTQRLLKAPFMCCAEARRDTLLDADHLKRNIHLRLINAHTKMKSLEKLISMASPAKILNRGFSITRFESGKLVRSGTDAHPGNKLITEFFSGTLKSTVED